MTAKRTSRRGKQSKDLANASDYPDLVLAIEQIETKLEKTSDPEVCTILAKWTETLKKIQTEMRHLERIEKYSGALSKLK